MGSFKPYFVSDTQFVELPILDAEFDVTGDEEMEMLVVYDAFGGIKHTVSTQSSEALYE